LQARCRIDDTEAIDGMRSLRIEPKGGTNWYYIVLDMPMPTTVGKKYTASFWVKAEAPRSLTVKWKATDNSIDWAQVDVQVTTDWAEYHTTAAAMNGTTKFEFHCAAVDTPFWLDFFNVYEGEYVVGVDPSGASDPGKAGRPTPADGAVIEQTAVLQWKSASLPPCMMSTSARVAEVAAAPDNTKVFIGRQKTDLLAVARRAVPTPSAWSRPDLLLR
jgi:hypothetical protein